MILEDVSNLSPYSHTKVLIKCDGGISAKCRKKYKKVFKSITRDRKLSGNKDYCFYCSRTIKFSGRNNPNCRYATLDDNFFSEIDTELKAYMLGWISSDGHIGKNNTIYIYVHKNDIEVLRYIKNAFCDELQINHSKKDMVYLSFSSKQIAKDILNHLEIKFENNNRKKAKLLSLPRLKNDTLTWHFIRGHFEGDGYVCKPTAEKKSPKCGIASYSKLLLEEIRDFCKIPGSLYSDQLQYSGNNALDFMSKIYEGANFWLSRKRDLYLDWCCWVPSLSGTGTRGRELNFKWNKTRKDAFPPTKTHATDSGYDLTLLEKVKSYGMVDVYDTGIKITPEFGWYFDMVPRSSIIKSGHILANSVGVIDRTYTGNILVPLIKLDPRSPDISKGTKLVQIIPRAIINLELEEVDELLETKRGKDGFGSTGK